MHKTGIMGGTFDPIHLGHLAIAEEACRELGLTEVIFMPAGHPYFKDDTVVSVAEDRVNMLRLALAGKPHYSISLMEIKRPGPTYAVETVTKLRNQLKAGSEIFFIMGWDSLMSLPRWQQPERLIRLCRIVAAPRPGYPLPDVSLIEKDLPGVTERTVVMDKPLVDISATEIRERVRQGLPVEDMVPAAVAAYIRDKGLYGAISKQGE
jgi:nicotinate-nucleotide adenylyltransferase